MLYEYIFVILKCDIKQIIKLQLFLGVQNRLMAFQFIAGKIDFTYK